MVKRLNKFMTILSVSFVAVVGVSSFSDDIINTYALETNHTLYLSVKWDKWDYMEDGDGSKRLMVKKDGGIWQDNFGELFNNKTAIFGSKDIYINLGGAYNLWFADHHNKEYHNYTTNSIIADSIMFDDSYMRFLFSGVVVATFESIDIWYDLNRAEDYYIIRSRSDGYDEGFYYGHIEGYSWGHIDGRNEGYELGRNDGYDEGFEEGYYLGLEEQDPAGFDGLLSTVFGGLGSLLAIEILPNIYIGAIIAVPLVFGIIFFILGKRKGD